MQRTGRNRHRSGWRSIHSSTPSSTSLRRSSASRSGEQLLGGVGPRAPLDDAPRHVPMARRRTRGRPDLATSRARRRERRPAPVGRWCHRGHPAPAAWPLDDTTASKRRASTATPPTSRAYPLPTRSMEAPSASGADGSRCSPASSTPPGPLPVPDRVGQPIGGDRHAVGHHQAGQQPAHPRPDLLVAAVVVQQPDQTRTSMRTMPASRPSRPGSGRRHSS